MIGDNALLLPSLSVYMCVKEGDKTSSFQFVVVVSRIRPFIPFYSIYIYTREYAPNLIFSTNSSVAAMCGIDLNQSILFETSLQANNEMIRRQIYLRPIISTTVPNGGGGGCGQCNLFLTTNDHFLFSSSLCSCQHCCCTSVFDLFCLYFLLIQLSALTFFFSLSLSLSLSPFSGFVTNDLYARTKQRQNLSTPTRIRQRSCLNILHNATYRCTFLFEQIPKLSLTYMLLVSLSCFFSLSIYIYLSLSFHTRATRYIICSFILVPTGGRLLNF